MALNSQPIYINYTLYSYFENNILRKIQKSKKKRALSWGVLAPHSPSLYITSECSNLIKEVSYQNQLISQIELNWIILREKSIYLNYKR